MIAYVRTSADSMLVVETPIGAMDARTTKFSVNAVLTRIVKRYGPPYELFRIVRNVSATSNDVKSPETREIFVIELLRSFESNFALINDDVRFGKSAFNCCWLVAIGTRRSVFKQGCSAKSGPMQFGKSISVSAYRSRFGLQKRLSSSRHTICVRKNSGELAL
jgi:hypothetical protein